MIKRSIFQFCAHPLRSMEFVSLHILNPKVLHENQRIDVNPIPGALVINLGEVLQLISNDRFIRVLARTGVPRIAVASFLRQQPPPPGNASRLYGPIKELLSEESPSIYRETTVGRHDDLDYDTVYTLHSCCFSPWILVFCTFLPILFSMTAMPSVNSLTSGKRHCSFKEMWWLGIEIFRRHVTVDIITILCFPQETSICCMNMAVNKD